LVTPEYGGKRKGMVAQRPNHPIDNVRELQRRLFIAAKRHRERRLHARYGRVWRGDAPSEAWERKMFGTIRQLGGAHAV
jgi:hypothetical protein